MLRHLKLKTPAMQRQLRVRAKAKGTAERPRLHVFRSNRHLALQVINDESGQTLAAASTLKLKATDGNKTLRAKQAAEQLAAKLKQTAVNKLVFDRGANKYHGRVKIVAEVMRAHGLDV